MGDGQSLRLGLLIEVYSLNRSSLILCEENLFLFLSPRGCKYHWIPDIQKHINFKKMLNASPHQKQFHRFKENVKLSPLKVVMVNYTLNCSYPFLKDLSLLEVLRSPFHLRRVV